ncbi:platelet-activating factor acetylhydrolase, isoform II-domain-containing protein [Protomyces lactucae-debilis]|uniref:1-alkyl-2-acetylglycerophosphocholine esterase n=1 Tax=Protomyces lactucae-debilis TaxID=2754530 RepID=A0A1Y2F7Q5_PROLT|nr:platelet-activating factor acetylhydrolase, isoform II-domain-containing protein [Protomyces lactucae-debilis]ORY79514.1 platelet-activating factor acetylhydrolase, isoform II-domain-containing protein [Protomyces lactucae-debilis]
MVATGAKPWTLPEYAGPHKVGTRLLEVPVDERHRITLPFCPQLRTLKLRIFYPTADTAACETSDSSRPLWATKEQIAGFATFAGLPGGATFLHAPLSYLLSDIKTPAYTDAPLLSSEHKRPFIVFSPGLGGTDQLYSAMCGNLASFGLIVFAMEHRDHSASSTIIREVGRPDEHVSYYSPVKQELLENRQRSTYMLAHRCFELRLLVDLLRRGAIMEQDSLDWDKFTLMGHSFGGATLIQALDISSQPLLDLQGNEIHLPSNDLDLQALPKVAIALDLWTQPLPSHVDVRVPLLHLVSEEFAAWPSNHDRLLDYCTVFEAARKVCDSSLDDIEETVSEGVNAEMEYIVIKDSLHLSQSDAGLLFPRLVTLLARKGRSPRRVLLDNVHQALIFLDRYGVLVYDDALAQYSSSQPVTPSGSPRTSLEQAKDVAGLKQDTMEASNSWWNWLASAPTQSIKTRLSVSA